METHFDNWESEFTKRHKPFKQHGLLYHDCTDHDEQRITQEYMAKYGIQNVRGGPWSQIMLSDAQEECIQHILDSEADACYTCGEKGHFAQSCSQKGERKGKRKAKKHRSESEPEPEPEPDDGIVPITKTERIERFRMKLSQEGEWKQEAIAKAERKECLYEMLDKKEAEEQAAIAKEAIAKEARIERLCEILAETEEDESYQSLLNLREGRRCQRVGILKEERRIERVRRMREECSRARVLELREEQRAERRERVQKEQQEGRGSSHCEVYSKGCSYRD